MFGTREDIPNWYTYLRIIGKAVLAENWANCKIGFNESANFVANKMI